MNATQAHWTNIFFPWQIFAKDETKKIHWSNALLPWQIFVKQKEVIEPQPMDLEMYNNGTNSSNQTVYMLIALAIGLCLAFLFIKI